MSKTETVRQLTAAATAQRLEGIASQIETVRQAKAQSVEELAATLEPLAQAMARLTDETSQHLTRVEEVVLRQAAKFEDQLEAQAQSWNKASAAAEKAAKSLQGAGWKHHALSALIGGSTAVLVSVFWLWLAPPTIANQLDPKATAEYLQPALIEAVQPSAARPRR